MEIRLHKNKIIKDIVSVEYRAEIKDPKHCHAGGHVVLHTLTVRNPNCGVWVANITVEYMVDSSRAQVCEGTEIKTCRPEVRALTVQLPPAKQAYWLGAEKKFLVRTCMVDNQIEDDFNLSYRVTADLRSRDVSRAEPEIRHLVIESTMHVSL